MRLSLLRLVTIFIITILVQFASFAEYQRIDGIEFHLRTDGTAAMYSGKFTGKVTVPAYVTYAGKKYTVDAIVGSFNGCSSVTEILMPNTIKTIKVDGAANTWGDRNPAFGGTSIQSLDIPNSISFIDPGVFIRTTLLRTINVSPENPTFVSIDGALYSADKSILYAVPNGVTHFTVPSFVKTIKYAAFDFYNYEDDVLYIPDNVTKLETGSVHRTQAKALVIGEGIEEIPQKLCGQNSTWVQSIELINIGSNVKKIGHLGFWYCENVNTVICNAITPPTCYDQRVFYSVNSDVYSRSTLYVPDESVDDYKFTFPWMKFSNIKGLSQSGIESAIETSIMHHQPLKGGIQFQGKEKAFVHISSTDGRIHYSDYVIDNQTVSLPQGFYIVVIDRIPYKIIVR